MTPATTQNAPPGAAQQLQGAITRFTDAQLHDGEKALLAALVGITAQAAAESARAGLWLQGSAVASGMVAGAMLGQWVSDWPRLALAVGVLVACGICLGGARWHFATAAGQRRAGSDLHVQLTAVRLELSRRGQR
jgi:hypothetical protein